MTDPLPPLRRIPMISGDEQDALTGSKRYYGWRPGQRKQIKRGYQRRMRKMVREAIRGAESGES